MKNALLPILLLVAVPALAQTAPPVKTYASAADVQAALAKAKAEHKDGNTIEKLAGTTGYTLQLEYRTGATPPTVHPTQDELIGGISGSATLVTGGKLVGIKPGAPGAGTIVGTAIEGGTEQPLAKGDYLLVPANTPHWFKDVHGPLAVTAMHMPAKR